MSTDPDRLGILVFLAQEAHGLLADPAPDHLLQADKRAAAYKQNIGRIHRGKFLVGMLAAALRRHVCDGALQDLQQRLLDALARNVAGNRGIFVPAADFVALVNIYDTLLAPLHVSVGSLQKLEDDVLHILAYIAGFG